MVWFVFQELFELTVSLSLNMVSFDQTIKSWKPSLVSHMATNHWWNWIRLSGHLLPGRIYCMESLNLRLPVLSMQNSMTTGFIDTSLTRTLPDRLLWGVCVTTATCVTVLSVPASHISPWGITDSCRRSRVCWLCFRIGSPTSLHLIHIHRFPIEHKYPFTLVKRSKNSASVTFVYTAKWACNERKRIFCNAISTIYIASASICFCDI